MIKKIVIHPYNPEWPETFKKEAALIKRTLGENCLEIHHIGSTSVPGLDAKEDIDMMCLVNSLPNSLQLEKIGYIFKGELNIPLRYFFSKNTDQSKVNLHVVEPGHGFIELNLSYRNYLRSHDEVRDAYGKLKKEIIKDPKAYEKAEGRFPKYTFRKNAFIKKTLQDAGYRGTTVNFCAHDAEWEAAEHLRQKYFFDKAGFSDPYKWTFNHPDHAHFVFYKGVDIIGYAHIQLWPHQRAALRMIVIDEANRGQGFGQKFLEFIEKWLKSKAYKSIHTESSPEALPFYIKQGYTEMPFKDPDGYKSDPRDIALGRKLK